MTRARAPRSQPREETGSTEFEKSQNRGEWRGYDTTHLAAELDVRRVVRRSRRREARGGAPSARPPAETVASSVTGAAAVLALLLRVGVRLAVRVEPSAVVAARYAAAALALAVVVVARVRRARARTTRSRRAVPAARSLLKVARGALAPAHKLVDESAPSRDDDRWVLSGGRHERAGAR